MNSLVTPQFEVASGALVALIGAFLLWRSIRHNHHGHERDGRTLAFVMGTIPCPLTTFIMSYALAEVDDKGGGQYQRREQRVLSSCALARRDG